MADKNEELTRLSADIPAGLHRRFKIACLKEGISMSLAITDLIRQSLKPKKT